ncbi:DUF3857 domain-containing protein [bacterium]|nr:DUF3857 domain-containing protein [bacterium]
MKRFILFSLLFLLIFSSYAVDVDALIKNSPAKDSIKEAKAIYLLNRTTVDHRENAKEKVHSHFLIKILRTGGEDRFGDQHIYFDKGLEKVNILKARTYADGKWIEVDRKKAIKVLSRFTAFSAGDYYPNARQLVVAFPALGENAVIELEYTKELLKRKKCKEKKLIYGEAYLQGSTPMENVERTYIFDKENDLKTAFKNDDKQFEYTFTEKDNGTSLIYTFRSGSIPMIINEPYMESYERFVPIFIFSNIGSYDEYSQYVYKKMFARTEKCGKTFKNDNGLIKFMTEDVRDVWFSFSASGFSPYKLKKILKNRYAGQVDKAYLLYYLLKDNGKSPQFCFVQNREPLFKDFIIPSKFSAFTCYDGEKAYNVESDSIDYDSTIHDKCKIFVIGEKAGKWIEIGDKIKPKETDCTISIDKNGDAEIEYKIIYNGEASTVRNKYRDKDEDEYEKMITEFAKEVFPNSKIISYDIENIDDREKAPVISIRLKKERYVKFSDNIGFLNLRENRFAVSKYFSKDDRKYGLELAPWNKMMNLVHYNISIDGLTFDYIPSDIAVKTDLFDESIKFTKEGNSIKIEKMLNINSGYMCIETYEKEKDNVNRKASELSQIVIKKQ